MRPEFSGEMHFSANGDAADLLVRLSNFVAEMQRLGIDLRTTVTLAATAPAEAAEAAQEAATAPVDPTPAARPKRKPSEPPDPAQWDLTPRAGKRPPQSRGKRPPQPTISQEMVDQTILALAEGAQFPDQEREMREEIVLQFGASLVEKLGRAPKQQEFDDARPEWMPSASSITMTWERPWAELQAAFVSLAER
jgi:hypothetical protein